MEQPLNPFVVYPSIDQFSQKFIERLNPSRNLQSSQDITPSFTGFAVTEKIDGSNGCIIVHLTDHVISLATRNVFIGPLSSLDDANVFGSVPIFRFIQSTILDLTVLIQSIIPTISLPFVADAIHIFGEIYGNSIQKTKYSEDASRRFIVFDIFLVDRDRKNAYALPLTIVQSFCKQVSMDCISTLFEGSFMECKEYSAYHLRDITLVPGPGVQIREGHVIRSNTTLEPMDCEKGRIRGKYTYYGLGYRCKHKGDLDEIRRASFDYKQYLTTKRFESLYDKENRDKNSKRMEQWVDEFIQDAWDEWNHGEKDENREIEEHESKAMPSDKVKKHASRIVSAILHGME